LQPIDLSSTATGATSSNFGHLWVLRCGWDAKELAWPGICTLDCGGLFMDSIAVLRRYALVCALAMVAVAASGCAAVAGIFKAGLWVGVILAVLVIGGGLFVFSRFR
jgi:hypothetical protein